MKPAKKNHMDAKYTVDTSSHLTILILVLRAVTNTLYIKINLKVFVFFLLLDGFFFITRACWLVSVDLEIKFYFRIKTIEFNDYRNLNDAHFNSSWNKNPIRLSTWTEHSNVNVGIVLVFVFVFVFQSIECIKYNLNKFFCCFVLFGSAFNENRKLLFDVTTWTK